MNVYGVIFKDRGKVYYFNGHDLEIEKDGIINIETERGLQFGRVVSKMEEDTVKSYKDTLKDIVRIATKKDYNLFLNNQKDADEALKTARKISNELDLEMSFIDASFTFDKKQLLFNFYADERIDFRELAKKLASIYHTRIELRQVGARDKAENVGGIGVCGRSLCCSSCLNHLDPVTINMAKNQNLALNPSKINGACGRLLCCLAYEDDEYQTCMKGMPSVGSKVKTSFGVGNVLSVDILNRKYKALINDEIKEIYVDYDKRA